MIPPHCATTDFPDAWKTAGVCPDCAAIMEARIGSLESHILRNSDPYDMSEPDAETFHEIGIRLIPQNY